MNAARKLLGASSHEVCRLKRWGAFQDERFEATVQESRAIRPPRAHAAELGLTHSDGHS